MTTHISYETAKMLKEFLGESAPEPMGKGWWTNERKPDGSPWLLHKGDAEGYGKMGIPFVPAYQLHDLLSKPFCEAMATRRDKMVCVPGKTQGRNFIEGVAECIAHDLLTHYYDGSLPSVERALMEMMK